jgi:purine catabolism regulator
MLTIHEALQLPVFTHCQVVAGHSGLDNQIQWVHIVDIPDTTYAWQRKGVLLLTAGYGLRDNPESQKKLIPILVKQGFAGMVLSTGYYFDHTPQVILESADASGFPVIEAPPNLLFIEITETVLERIISRQYTLLQQSTKIFTQLTNLVLEGVNLDGLAQVLADLIGRSITIEDTRFRVLAAAQHGPVAEARNRSIRDGQTPAELAQHLREAGIYDTLLEQKEPLHVPPMPEMGMLMERFVTPIIAGREIHGYIWIIAGDHPLTQLDEMAIQHGAIVAALILFKEIAVQKAEEKLKGDFLDQLLRGEYETAQFSEQARQLNFQVNQPHQVLLIAGLKETKAATRSLVNEITNWFRRQRLFPLIAWRDPYLVLILENGVAKQGKTVAAKLAETIFPPTEQLLIGAGGAYESSNSSQNNIRRSYQEAEEAVRIALALNTEKGVVAFYELGLLHWLYQLSPETQADNIYLTYIQELRTYDQERDAELVKTLETYLEHGGALVDTAQALFIHRNTLLHRLERIESLCQIDLRHPLQRLNLFAAVKSYRMHGRL